MVLNIRPFNLIGKFEDDKVAKMSHVIPELIKKLKRPSKKIRIYGDGYQERSFTSVSEAAESIYIISNKRNCENQTFNIGTEESTSINKLIKLLSKNLKIKKKIIRTKSFASDVKFNKCNSSKIFSLTGYKPKKKIKNIIADLIL